MRLSLLIHNSRIKSATQNTFWTAVTITAAVIVIAIVVARSTGSAFPRAETPEGNQNLALLCFAMMAIATVSGTLAEERERRLVAIISGAFVAIGGFGIAIFFTLWFAQRMLGG